MAGGSTLVARLAGSVEWTAIRCSAVTGDVAEFTTRITLHCLGLAVSSIVIGSAALVACCSPVCGNAIKSSSATTATASRWSSTHVWSRTIASQVTDLTARIATTASRTTADAQGRTITLYVANSLTVVALFCLGCARSRALIGLMAWLLAVVAQSFGGCANLRIVAHVSAFVACTTGE